MRIIDILKKKWKIIFFVSFFISVIFFIKWKFFTKKIYEVKCSFVPSYALRVGQVNLFGVVTGFGGNVIYQLPLAIVESYAFRKNIAIRFNLFKLWGKKDTISVVKKIKKRVKADINLKTNVITLKILMEDPELGYQMALFTIKYIDSITGEIGAQIEKPYLEIIDPPVIPEKPKYPKSFLWSIILFVGLASSLLVIFLIYYEFR